MTHTSPVVGLSIPEIMFSSVLFPLPDFPMMLTNSPAWICRSMLFQGMVVACRAVVVLIHPLHVDHKPAVLICLLWFVVRQKGKGEHETSGAWTAFLHLKENVRTYLPAKFTLAVMPQRIAGFVSLSRIVTL